MPFCLLVNVYRINIINGGYGWNWRSKSVGQMTYLALRARLDTAGVGEIELSFKSHTVPRANPLLLDISDITFLASLGLRMLLTVAKALDRRGAKTVLLSPQPAVRKVLKLSGFDQLMPVHNDEETALAFLADSEGR
jgi:anti-sigma B factor antagonist